MATKNEGRFASLKALRHQRLAEDEVDVSADDETEKEVAPPDNVATANVETIEAKPEGPPKEKRSVTGARSTKSKEEQKPSKASSPQQEIKQPGPGRPRGRRSNPDYTQITAYVPLSLYLDIQDELTREKRELRKRSAKNASELIEELLTEWLATRKTKNAKH